MRKRKVLRPEDTPWTSTRLYKRAVREYIRVRLTVRYDDYTLRIYSTQHATRPIFSMGNTEIGMATVELLKKLGHRVEMHYEGPNRPLDD